MRDAYVEARCPYCERTVTALVHSNGSSVVTECPRCLRAIQVVYVGSEKRGCKWDSVK